MNANDVVHMFSGFGDDVPITSFGKVIASLAALFGIVVCEGECGRRRLVV